jgi:indole-3-glycerol phosphate synthase
MTILDEIIEHKRLGLAAVKQSAQAKEWAQAAKQCSRKPIGFRAAIESSDGVAVIAEIKRQSPSKGLIREDFDAVLIAEAYQSSGAACISVLTDERFFGGSLEDLIRVREVVDLPLLRKDFFVDPIQIDEARLAGADAVLLIVAALDDEELAGLHGYAEGLGLDVLVEVHDEQELDRALVIGSQLIGINNRNLRTFTVDLGTTERLAGRLSGSGVVLIAESGISDAKDVRRLTQAGAAGFLVGESLMRQPDPGSALRNLRGLG